MLEKETILTKLNAIHEHVMARDIFVPVLKKMGCKGVKFTGGTDEVGIDIEYFELTQPEKLKSYVGVQFKKGNLVYSSGGSKNSVKEVRNQAEEAFEKEIHDIGTHATLYISRFVVATTGDINEKARSFIGKARQKGNDRRIDYWTGDRLAEYVQQYWMEEFKTYFSIDEEDVEEYGAAIVDEEYVRENYEELVSNCKKVRSTVNSIELEILDAVLSCTVQSFGGWVPMADVLMELGNSEDYYNEEFKHLYTLGYLDFDDRNVCLSGHAAKLEELYGAILNEAEDAEEDLEPDEVDDIFWSLVS